MSIAAEQVRILLVDDHSLFRQSLRFMLQHQEQFAVVGEAGDGIEALAKAHELMPDIVLMDIRMPRCSGLLALERLRKDLPAINVVMLTVSEDDEDLFAAVKAGAKGYLLKTIGVDELVRALQCVSRGGAVVSPVMAARLLAEFASLAADSAEDSDADAPQLTSREKDILELVAQGLANKEIAVSLCIAESTVKAHLRNIMEKLHLHNRAQAAAFAARQLLTRKRSHKRL